MSSSFSWAYFLADDRWEPADRTLRLNAYVVTSVARINGDVALSPPAKLLRLESSRRLAAVDRLPTPLFSGVTQHLQYTDAAQRRELLRGAAAESPPSSETVAVIIPIRKSGSWWDMAQDERMAFFRKTAAGDGHTTIGLPYAQSIFRRLYHCRYLESAPAFDFITYFEFPADRTEEFMGLLHALRDVKRNPEWKYVDAEVEIWARKVR